MISLTPENLLESLVRITQERSQDSLEISLVTSMLELLPAREIALIKVLFGDLGQVEEVIRAGRAQDTISMRRLSTLDPDLEACLADGISNKKQPRCGGWLLYPIWIQERLLRVVMLHCESCSQEDAALIEAFLRVYRNYVEVLHDSERDTLTGLLNRKTFEARIMRILAAFGGRQLWDTPLAKVERRGDVRGQYWLGMFDIDHFKRINDKHGHLYGDEVLLLLAQIMRTTFRAGDLLFRYGGEEFVVVLQAHREGALSALERFRRNVEAYQFPQVGQVTVSIGAVQITPNDVPLQVVGRADQALYYAKSHGRNRMCSYEKLLAEGELKATAIADDIEIF